MTEFFRFLDVMSRVKDRDSGLVEPFEGFEDRISAWVSTPRRFVEDQEVRLMNEPRSNIQDAASCRERSRHCLVGANPQPHQIEDSGDAFSFNRPFLSP